MLILKKLLFALPFLILLALTLSQAQTLYANPFLILSLDSSILYFLITLTLSILFTSLCFVLFASLSNDWRIIPAPTLLGALLGFILGGQYSLILFLGILITTFFSFSLISQTLKTYLNFEPVKLFLPQVRNFARLLSLALAIAFFLSVSQEVKLKGFEIPDSLIDASLKLAPQEQTQTTNLPQVDPSALETLKQNPALLKQYGITPDQLSQLTQPKGVDNSVKQAVKTQVQAMIAPYLGIVPFALSALFYLTLTSLLSLSYLLLYLLLPVIFQILEKTHYISFTTEQRTIKKLVV